MVSYLDFEKSLSDIEGKIRELNELRLSSNDGNISIDDISKLEKRSQDWLEDKYSNLSTWEKTQVARHPNRPHFTNYAEGILDNFVILSGDRLFGEDKAIIGGLGKIDNQSVMLIGHEKGNDTLLYEDNTLTGSRTCGENENIDSATPNREKAKVNSSLLIGVVVGLRPTDCLVGFAEASYAFGPMLG